MHKNCFSPLVKFHSFKSSRILKSYYFNQILMREQTFSLSDSAANSLPAERAAFIRRTYAHLAVAILLFTGLEYYLVNAPFAAKLAASMTGGISLLIVFGLFMGVSYIANKLATSGGSQQMQYLGLGLFIIAEAILFLPCFL